MNKINGLIQEYVEKQKVKGTKSQDENMIRNFFKFINYSSEDLRIFLLGSESPLSIDKYIFDEDFKKNVIYTQKKKISALERFFSFLLEKNEFQIDNVKSNLNEMISKLEKVKMELNQRCREEKRKERKDEKSPQRKKVQGFFDMYPLFKLFMDHKNKGKEGEKAATNGDRSESDLLTYFKFLQKSNHKNFDEHFLVSDDFLISIRKYIESVQNFKIFKRKISILLKFVEWIGEDKFGDSNGEKFNLNKNSQEAIDFLNEKKRIFEQEDKKKRETSNEPKREKKLRKIENNKDDKIENNNNTNQNSDIPNSQSEKRIQELETKVKILQLDNQDLLIKYEKLKIIVDGLSKNSPQPN